MGEFRSFGGDRKLEIVPAPNSRVIVANGYIDKGENFPSRRVFHDHMYVTRTRSPSPTLRPPLPLPPPSTTTTSATTTTKINHNRRASGGTNTSYSSPAASWSLDNPEMKRRKRVAMYKSYGVESKVKFSLKRSVRWIKNSCSKLIHGF